MHGQGHCRMLLVVLLGLGLAQHQIRSTPLTSAHTTPEEEGEKEKKQKKTASV
jgi:hypothetical protein